MAEIDAMRRRSLCAGLLLLLAAVVLLLGPTLDAGAAVPPVGGLTPDGAGNYAECNVAASGDFYGADCAYGVYATADPPVAVQAFIAGYGWVTLGAFSAGGGLLSGQTIANYGGNPIASVRVLYSDGTTHPAGLAATDPGHLAMPPDSFASGLAGIPDPLSSNGAISANSTARTTMVGYVLQGVTVIVLVAIAGTGAGLLVKYVKRAAEAA